MVSWIQTDQKWWRIYGTHLIVLYKKLLHRILSNPVLKRAKMGWQWCSAVHPSSEILKKTCIYLNRSYPITYITIINCSLIFGPNGCHQHAAENIICWDWNRSTSAHHPGLKHKKIEDIHVIFIWKTLHVPCLWKVVHPPLCSLYLLHVWKRSGTITIANWCAATTASTTYAAIFTTCAIPTSSTTYYTTYTTDINSAIIVSF